MTVRSLHGGSTELISSSIKEGGCLGIDTARVTYIVLY